MKLTIELVPKTAWYTNVRSIVSKSEWDKLRKSCYKKAGHICEICGGKGNKWPVECHEIWEYDDDNKIQKLSGLIALCPNCHKTKHAGLAKLNGEIGIVISQLMKVNGMSRSDATSYIKKAFITWDRRSKYKWKCNTEYLSR